MPSRYVCSQYSFSGGINSMIEYTRSMMLPQYTSYNLFKATIAALQYFSLIMLDEFFFRANTSSQFAAAQL